MRTGSRWTFTLAAAALGLAATLAALPRADAKEPDAVEAKGLASVRAAMKMLVETREGPVPGVPKEEALPMLSKWAPVVTDWMIPLEVSPYALGPDVRGLVRIYVGDEGADDLSIHLFVTGVERKRLRSFVMEAGRGLGYEMHDDDENPWACYGFLADHRDLWIGVGEGLVSIEVNPP